VVIKKNSSAAKMVIRYNDIVHVITTLADEEKITVAVKETLKGSLIAGGACAVCGLVLGPVGFAIGGAVGGGIAYCLAKDKFKPLSHIILHEMSAEHQRQLVDSVKNIVSEVDAADAVEMLALLSGNMLLKAKIAEEMTRFAAHQMNLQIGQ